MTDVTAKTKTVVTLCLCGYDNVVPDCYFVTAVLCLKCIHEIQKYIYWMHTLWVLGTSRILLS